MLILGPEDPRAVAVVKAIRGGDVEGLVRLLGENPDLATARVAKTSAECASGGKPRTLLHIATDWPGHFPNGVATVKGLIAAGADVDVQVGGMHEETPLHWAASSDDVGVLDALLDTGANIEAPGAVIGGGTPLSDAVAFGQWQAARRLIERGAKANLWQAAALGLVDRVKEFFAGDAAPSPDDITNAFWCACHGGQRATAEYLLGRGADINWIGHDKLTPFDTARRSEAHELVAWLVDQGAKSAKELS
ncbi:MAG TPA: ankyrin repeat domain-containing protein [Planctomycetaceae bacterium]|jgi:ankyrin repeat protein|nr:ankyrin repeat domain-containing protein [Planctomycetaceae bacterium]